MGATMDTDPLLIGRHGPVTTLTLNRPMRRNALTVELANQLLAALAHADGDPAVRVVILQGYGGHFCSGLDLQAAFRDHSPSPAEGAALVQQILVGSLHPLMQRLWEMSKPTIGALSGATVGFGLSLALACDLRLMGETSYLSTQFAARGLFPDGGVLYQLERICGLGHTLELALRPDRRLTAIEAQAMGLSGRTVGDAALEADAFTLAQELARGAPLPQTAIKRALKGAEFAKVLAAEVASVSECLRSHDALEGAMAFLEKRPPVFKGE
jgi:2-(1,2-epoxy-1,2-dihydrophenyl)acetyl-CoA isomerase